MTCRDMRSLFRADGVIPAQPGRAHARSTFKGMLMPPYSNKNGLNVVTRLRVAALFVVLWAAPVWCVGTEESLGPGAMIPASYDVVARVQINIIEHSLRASDARRIQYGAAPPLVPYKAELAVRQTCPQVKLPRLRLEGIVATGWMPEVESRGLLLLTESGGKYLPAAPFPCQGYLPEIEQDGVSKIDFPPASGCLVPASLVWECLCDVRSARAGTLPPERVETWRLMFQEHGEEDALTALYFLLNVPGDLLSFESLSMRFASSGTESPAPLSPAPVVQQLAAFLVSEQAATALQLALDAAPRVPADALAKYAWHSLALAGRAPVQERAALYEAVFAREWEQENGAKVALIPGFDENEALFIAGLEKETGIPLLTRMLEEPSRFPALRRQPDLARFWKLLSEGSHPGLADYLRRFLADPTPAFLGIPITASAVQELAGLAQRLAAPTAGAGAP